MREQKTTMVLCLHLGGLYPNRDLCFGLLVKAAEPEKCLTVTIGLCSL